MNNLTKYLAIGKKCFKKSWAASIPRVESADVLRIQTFINNAADKHRSGGHKIKLKNKNNS